MQILISQFSFATASKSFCKISACATLLHPGDSTGSRGKLWSLHSACHQLTCSLSCIANEQCNAASSRL